MSLFKRLFFLLSRLPLYIFSLFAKLNYLSDDETLDFLLSKEIGITRFGNSELAFISGSSIKHQVFDPLLRNKLLHILDEVSNQNHCLVSLPIDVTIRRRGTQRFYSKSVWRFSLCIITGSYVKSKYIYGSPFVFRSKDIVVANKSTFLSSLELLFSNKSIMFIGPKFGRNSGLPDFIKPDYYCYIPESNAFSQYDRLRVEAISFANTHPDHLILIVAGITATALSYELSMLGVLAYDFGQFNRHFEESIRFIK